MAANHNLGRIIKDLERLEHDLSKEGRSSAITRDTVAVIDVVLSEELKIIMANPSAHELFGYLPGGLVGRSAHELVPHDLREQHLLDARVYCGKPVARPMGSVNGLVKGQRADGTLFPVAIALYPYTENLEHFCQAVLLPLPQKGNDA